MCGDFLCKIIFYSDLFLFYNGYIRCKKIYDWRKRYER